MHRRSGLRCAHHFAPSLREPPPLTRRPAVLQRRHCQRAASNDARRSTCVVVVRCPHRADAWSVINVAGPARPRDATEPRRACEGKLSPHVERRAPSKGCVHPCTVKIAGRHRASGRNLLRSIELQRRVTTATPFGARDGREGKEPRERMELTARACVGQWAACAFAGVCR